MKTMQERSIEKALKRFFAYRKANVHADRGAFVFKASMGDDTYQVTLRPNPRQQLCEAIAQLPVFIEKDRTRVVQEELAKINALEPMGDFALSKGSTGVRFKMLAKFESVPSIPSIDRFVTTLVQISAAYSSLLRTLGSSQAPVQKEQADLVDATLQEGEASHV